MSFLTTNSQFRLALVGICVVTITGGLGRFAYTPIIPYMQNTLNISSADIGLIASSNYLGYLIGSIIPLIYSIKIPPGNFRCNWVSYCDKSNFFSDYSYRSYRSSFSSYIGFWCWNVFKCYSCMDLLYV